MMAGEGDLVVLPGGLRDRVLAASLRARAAGRPTPAPEEMPPAEAFSRAADALHGALSSLRDEEWRRPALRGLDVQGLVGHMIGVEEDVQRALAGDPAVAEADHVESTQAAAVRQEGRPPAETREEWRRAVEATLGLARDASPGGQVAVHGLRLPPGALLVVRAFELWTHDNDIRRAAGLPPSVPDAATLRLMTDLAAGLLPRAAARAGLAGTLGVHLVLTGPGGGTWDVALGGSTAEPVLIAVVADAVGFCRLVAGRLGPADLEAHITGDPGRAAEVLAAAGSLALD